MPSSADLWSEIESSLNSEQFLLFVLSRPRSKQETKAPKLTIRPITVKDELQYQFTRQVNGQDFHENHNAAETFKQIQKQFPDIYTDCHLYATKFDLSARTQKANKLRIKKKPPSKQPRATEHNRTKQYLIPENVPCPFLEEIGVMTAQGKVRASRYNKFRQINRFLELVNDVVPSLPANGTLQIVDFGCGKSYLTFALHHLLANIQKRDVNIVGLDRRKDVIETCNKVADQLELTGLRFEQGDITQFNPDQQIDMAVSLHACDTATDDVLAQAIDWNAKVILSVPCCQHEIAALLPKSHLGTITQHGILKERYAAMATDALRAKMLEAFGYQVKIVEFIDMEHTAKNLLIRAVKIDRQPQVLQRRREEFIAFREELGLPKVYLERILDR